MQKLIEGYLHFRAHVFPHRESLFQSLAESQAPKVLFITCSDSRIAPDLLLQTEPGDMFHCRNAGNVVPTVGIQVDGTAATIEYALDVLKVEHVIVCGHSNCGAVRAAQKPGSADTLPMVKPWVLMVEAAQRVGAASLDPSGDDDHARFHDLVCANVVGQLANLRAYPSVERALAAGALEIHGWYYDIPTGTIEAYAPGRRTFLPLQNLSNRNA